MDGSTGFKTAATEELPDAVALMDLFHIVRLAGDVLNQVRSRPVNRRRVRDPQAGFRRQVTKPSGDVVGVEALPGPARDRNDQTFPL